MARILRSKSSNFIKKNGTITTSCGDNSRDIVKDIIASIPSCYRARMFTSLYFLKNQQKIISLFISKTREYVFTRHIDLY